MRRMVILLAMLCAQEAWADAASYRQAVDDLMSATQAENIIAGWRKRYEAQAMDLVTETLQGRSEAQLSEAQREAVRRFRMRGKEALEQGLSWEKLREPTRQAYMEAFSESEARELAAFYRTPLGQKLLTRLPVVSDGVARGVRTQIDAMRPQLQGISAEFSSEFERAGRPLAARATPPVEAAPAKNSSPAPAACNPKVGCRK